MFENGSLNQIIESMPAGIPKMKALLIFSLVDGFLTRKISKEDFTNDLYSVINTLDTNKNQ